ncbi:hypothetical protein BGW36DRAFT_385826, partial [Talaromyces proteolyticus]
MDRSAVIAAYRHLYRKGLQAIRYATPGRHVLRRSLRSAFEHGDVNDFNSKKIANTIRFLERAAESTGLEHRIVKNLLHVRFWEQPHMKRPLKNLDNRDARQMYLKMSARTPFNSTLMLLNESLGTCL